LSLGPNSAALEGLGFAAYLAMNFDEAIAYWQQSYAGYRADGNGVGAVRVARMLGYMYGIVVGDWAIGSLLRGKPGARGPRRGGNGAPR
jgi:hypothetical protein